MFASAQIIAIAAHIARIEFRLLRDEIGGIFSCVEGSESVRSHDVATTFAALRVFPSLSTLMALRIIHKAQVSVGRFARSIDIENLCGIHVSGSFAMISFEQCADFAGLAANELASCSPQSSMSRSLYASYLLHIGKGACVVRDMIVSDMRSSRELGATKQAADLAAVLRAFLSDHPEGRLALASDAAEILPFASSRAVPS